MSWRNHREALVCAGNTRFLRLYVLLTFSVWACQVNLHGPHGDEGGSAGSQQPSGGTHATCGGEAGAGGSALNGGASGAVEAGAPTQPDAGESSGGGTEGGTGGASGGTEGGMGGAAHAGVAGEADGGATDGGSSCTGHAGAAGETGGPSCGQAVIEVTSLIDGLDRLTITPELLWFDHLSHAGPGLESFRTDSTRVDVSIGGITDSVAWCPIWENDCNTCSGSCGELRATPVRSRALCGEYFPGRISNLTFSCTGAEERPGAACSLTQEPSEANGQLAIVTFDDELAGGPAYYTARLAFDYGPDASGECDSGSPPESCDPPPDGDPCEQQGEIEVTTLIDGYDRLTITPDSIQFHHFTHAGPGMASFRTEPTALNVTLPSSSTELEWCPTWQNGCNTCDGSCGELQEIMQSVPLDVELFRGCPSDFEFSCSGPEDRPYAFCTLRQVPSAINGYTAVIDFDDDYTDGAAYLTARLRYQFSEGLDCGCSE